MSRLGRWFPTGDTEHVWSRAGAETATCANRYSGAGAESDGGYRIERGADVMECRLAAEGEEDVQMASGGSGW